QSARREGRRRSRRRRRSARHHQRGHRCAGALRRAPHRHAGDARTGVARHPIGGGEMSATASASLVVPVLEIATDAGRIILNHYRTDVAVRAKSDLSPVTAADEEAEHLIVERLHALTLDTPVISEEAFARGEIADRIPGRFWLVDPLDGTKEFLRHNGEFTVNIALIDHGTPILGVVGAPALSLSFTGAGPGSACEWRGGCSHGIRPR